MGKNFSYGAQTKKNVGDFLQWLLNEACRQDSVGEKSIWLEDKQLQIKNVRIEFLQGSDISISLIRDVLNHYLTKFLGIAQDKRTSEDRDRGLWNFTFDLSTVGVDLKKFEAFWEKKNGERKLDSPTKTDNLSSLLPITSIREGIRDRQNFVGRDEDLEELHKRLNPQGPEGNTVAISGMTGLGKSELALQYAKEYKSCYTGGIYEIRANDSDIVSQIVSFTQGAFLDRSFEMLKEMLPLDRVRYCWKLWLESGQKQVTTMLIIFDDVSNYGEVKDFLPPQEPIFRIVLTTQLVIPKIANLLLKDLPEEAALQQLEVTIGKERVQAELDIAKRLCEHLGFLPLALELVASYLHLDKSKSLSLILTELTTLKGITHKALDTRKRTSTADRGVEEAFQLSWNKLDRAARRMAVMLSVFAPNPIPWGMCEKLEQYYCQLKMSDFNRESLDKSKQDLLELHLLKYVKHEGEDWYELHSLIRQFFKEKMDSEFGSEIPNDQG